MTTSALVAVTAASLVNFLVVSRIVLRPRDARIDVPKVAGAAAALCILLLLEALPAWLFARSFFLVIALAYASVMLLVPVTGITLLLASRRRVVTQPVRILGFASLAILPIFVDATFVEPYRLLTEHVEVAIEPMRSLPRPLLVGVLADIQCVKVTDRERDAVARVMAAQPDLILLPGDLQQAGFDHLEEMAGEMRDLLAPLDAPLGVFYVEGNTESTGEARILLAGTRVRVLDDEIVRLEHAGLRVTLCGVDLGISARALAVLDELEVTPGATDLRIVVAHRPDVIHALRPHTRIDLVVAGHTHGGQVRLPFFGPPITLSLVPRSVAAGGLHELDGRRIYVSRGIGWEHGHAPRVRFLCPPEVTLLRLASSDSH